MSNEIAYYKTTNYFVLRNGDYDYCINLDDGELFFNEYFHDGEEMVGLVPSNMSLKMPIIYMSKKWQKKH